MTAPSETPLTDALVPHLNLSHSDMRNTAWKLRDHARSLETALAESRAEADKQRHIAANCENMAAMHRTERDEARAECERLRQQCQAEIASRSEAAARTIAAETREREALERAAKVCEEEICACCWDDDAQAAADHLADKIRALSGERRNDG